MWSTTDVLRVYVHVLDYEMERQFVTHDDFRTAVRRVKDAYIPNRKRLLNTDSTQRCNTVADCCVYLHLYAPLHTTMAYDIMKWILSEMREWFHIFLSSRKLLKICSLGGGPGADVIGVVTALQSEFGCFDASATIMDKIFDWKFIFSSVIREITSGCYADVGRWLSSQYFEWSYITTNLLRNMDQDVNDAIKDTDFIIMSKFISAVPSQKVSGMIKDIFKRMKPGTILLYIDNDGGKHHEIVSTIARQCHLVPLLTPLEHQHYSNEGLRINRFGSWSCCETKITVQIMEKRNVSPPVWNRPWMTSKRNNWDRDSRVFRPLLCRDLRNVDKYNSVFDRRIRHRRNRHKRRRN